MERVSKQLRAEFARGDGRVKRKEDARRSNITPSETLFVVNFQVDTTRKSDLELLFQPYGELIRIEMKKNYAFVQFATVEQAKTAKEATNGGKLDQSAISVEYVESRIRGPPRRRYEGEYRRPRPREYDRGVRGGPLRSEYLRREERYRDELPPPRRYDDSPRRDRRGRSPGMGYHDLPRRGLSRSRSRSPPMDHDRRPRYSDGYREREDYGRGSDLDRRGGGRYDHDGRGRSQERDFDDRGRGRSGSAGGGAYDRAMDRDRGYRYERGYSAGGRGGDPGDDVAR